MEALNRINLTYINAMFEQEYKHFLHLTVASLLCSLQELHVNE